MVGRQSGTFIEKSSGLTLGSGSAASGAGTPLDRCPNGFEGRIVALAGPAIILERLLELGFLRDEPIRLQGRTPLGEPLLVEVRGATVALRKSEAACLIV